MKTQQVVAMVGPSPARYCRFSFCSLTIGLVLLLQSCSSTYAKILYIEDFGGVPDSQILHHPKEPVNHPEFHHSSKSTTTSTPQQQTKQQQRLVYHEEYTNQHVQNHDLILLGQRNTQAFNKAIQNAKPQDTIQLRQDQSYTFLGGVQIYYKKYITLDFAGYVRFLYDTDLWPYNSPESGQSQDWYAPAIHVLDSEYVTLTSSADEYHHALVKVDYDKNEVYLDPDEGGSGGIIDGHGKKWWNDAIMGKMNGDKRPKLCFVQSSREVLVERLTLVNSPFWTLTVESRGAEVRFVNVLVDRNFQRELKNKTSALLWEEYLKDENEDEEEEGDSSTKRHWYEIGRVQEGRKTRRLGEVASKTSKLEKFHFPDFLPSWILQPQDLNTDGIDPVGSNIWIHDCIVQNDDDSIAVKPAPIGKFGSSSSSSSKTEGLTLEHECTRNVTIENSVLTGFGASIGSVGPNPNHPCVDDVTFRNIVMPGTGKGIYIKSNKSNCNGDVSSSITNIRYENIHIKQPIWWPIWIGPQAQHEPHEDLGGNCPLEYPMGKTPCLTQGCTRFENITLKDIVIDDPLTSPGVILGNSTNPMKNLVFENVTMRIPLRNMPFHGRLPFHKKKFPYSGKFQCENAIGTCKGCSPVPECFEAI